jgi:hypothetical protein
MQVMIERHHPFGEGANHDQVEDRAKTTALKELLERDEDFVRSAVQSLVQAALEDCAAKLRDQAFGSRSKLASATAIAETQLIYQGLQYIDA